MGVKKVYPDVIYDLANAIVLIRLNAETWNVGPIKSLSPDSQPEERAGCSI